MMVVNSAKRARVQRERERERERTDFKERGLDILYLILLLKCNTITKRQTQHPNTKAHRFFIKSGSIFLKMRRFDDDAALLRCARFEKSLSLAFLWRVEELGLEEQGFVHSLHGTLHVLHLRVGVPFEKV